MPYAELQVGDLVRWHQVGLGDPQAAYRVTHPADEHGRVRIEAVDGHGAWRALPAVLVLVERAR